jgi:hypothetical protein
MIESPLIQNIVQESKRTGHAQMIVRILQRKFGSVGPAIEAGLALVNDEEKLMLLGEQACTCTSLTAFEDALREELPKPRAASTRGKHRPRKSSE